MTAHATDTRGTRRPRTRTLRVLALAPLMALLSACYDVGIFEPGYGGGGSRYFSSGLYEYDTWSEDGRHAWWGTLDLRVRAGGEIEGTYRLPLQCEDSYGDLVDCYGYVAGRVHSDGTIRFGLDEGWLRHEGETGRYSGASGWWESRILGYYDSGDFELVPY